MFDAKEVRVISDYPRLKKTIKAAEQVKYDQWLQGSIDAIAQAVKVSFESMIDLSQALDILHELDRLAEALPEQDGKNILHKGYAVLAKANVHAARSHIYVNSKYKRGLSSKDITNTWQEICAEARGIPNITDRVYLMALVAAGMFEYYGAERRQRLDIDFLKEAEAIVNRAPTITDRVDLLETIADSGGQLGEKTFAQVVIEQAFTLVTQLQSAHVDERLRVLVQTAHQLDPELAETLVSKLDTSRLAGEAVHPVDCFCQPKIGPFDHQKEGHLGQSVCTLTIENRAT